MIVLGSSFLLQEWGFLMLQLAATIRAHSPRIKTELELSPVLVELVPLAAHPALFLPPLHISEANLDPSFLSPCYFTVLPLFAKPLFILQTCA